MFLFGIIRGFSIFGMENWKVLFSGFCFFSLDVWLAFSDVPRLPGFFWASLPNPSHSSPSF